MDKQGKISNKRAVQILRSVLFSSGIQVVFSGYCACRTKTHLQFVFKSSIEASSPAKKKRRRSDPAKYSSYS